MSIRKEQQPAPAALSPAGDSRPPTADERLADHETAILNLGRRLTVIEDRLFQPVTARACDAPQMVSIPLHIMECVKVELDLAMYHPEQAAARAQRAYWMLMGDVVEDHEYLA